MTQGEEQLYDKREVDTDHVKCAGCGANMEFDPASQKLVCRHCGRTEELEKQFGAPELDYLKGLDACEQWDGETVVFRCENCGAKVLLDRAQTAKLCPFCGTAHVVEAGSRPGSSRPRSCRLPSTRIPPCSGAKPGRKRDGWRRANSESACRPTA